MRAFLPVAADLVNAGFIILVFLAWTVVGAAIGGRHRRAAFDPLVGWAILCLPFVAIGTLSPLSFLAIDGLCVVVIAAAVAICAIRRIDPGLRAWTTYLALSLPFLVMVMPTDAYGWDQLSHWLPNASYILNVQHFPHEGLPAIHSMHAGYPYGFALAIYWVEMLSSLSGTQAKIIGVSAGLNVLLFAAAARALVDQAKSQAAADADAKFATFGGVLFGANAWAAAALAFLAVTALSPTFLPTNSISASADNPTTIALLAIALLLIPRGHFGEMTSGYGSSPRGVDPEPASPLRGGRNRGTRFRVGVMPASPSPDPSSLRSEGLVSPQVNGGMDTEYQGNAEAIRLPEIASQFRPPHRGGAGYASQIPHERTQEFVALSALLVLVVLLKEDGIVPALALMAGRVLWDARTGQDMLGNAANLALASLPMLAVTILWHAYVHFHIPGGEMSLRAPAEWRLDLVPQILSGMAGILVAKIGYFVCVVAAVVLAARAMRKPSDSATDAFAVIACACFVGYTVFLAFAYASIFAPQEAIRVAAFWRYETHLGLVLEAAVLLFVCTLPAWRAPAVGRIAWASVPILLLAPIVLAPVIRPDTDPQYRALRAIGRDVSEKTGGASTLAVVDQFGNGAPCPMIVYQAKVPLTVSQCVTKLTPCKACAIRDAAARETYIWTNGWSRELTMATKLDLPANASWLVRHEGPRWSVVAQWPRVPTKIRGVRAIWQTR